jgi:hypothetical protein
MGFSHPTGRAAALFLEIQSSSMIKQVILSSCFLALTLNAGVAGGQQGTAPDPMAGQSGAQPGGAPTNTPQAQQNASPAANAPNPQQNNAATAPTEAPPSTPAASDQPASKTGDANAPTTDTTSAPKADATSAPKTDAATAAPKTDAAPPTASVELTSPVTGPPETKIIDPSAIGKHAGNTGATDPLLDTPPLPKGKPTLVGGLAVKVDKVRNRVTVEPYGGKKKMPVFIDERSHIYRNGVETTIASIKKGDRVYFDTMLDGAHIFAKNVRVVSETGAAEVRGQITSYDVARGTIQLQDALSSRPVSFRVTAATHYKTGKGTASSADLAKGALVDVTFAPDKANRGIANEVVILARPGVSYTFAGNITNVNLRDGTVSVENQTDGKVYDIEFDTHSKSERGGLRAGNAVNITATFDGENYKATNVTVTQSAEPKKKSDEKKSEQKPEPKADDQQ